MKLYFSMWAYRDPNRVGYDCVEANYYASEPFGFRHGGDSESAYYMAEIPDTFTEKERDAIGERAVELLKTGYYSDAQRVVDMVLTELKERS